MEKKDFKVVAMMFPVANLKPHPLLKKFKDERASDYYTRSWSRYQDIDNLPLIDEEGRVFINYAQAEAANKLGMVETTVHMMQGEIKNDAWMLQHLMQHEVKTNRGYFEILNMSKNALIKNPESEWNKEIERLALERDGKKPDMDKKLSIISGKSEGWVKNLFIIGKYDTLLLAAMDQGLTLANALKQVREGKQNNKVVTPIKEEAQVNVTSGEELEISAKPFVIEPEASTSEQVDNSNASGADDTQHQNEVSSQDGDEDYESDTTEDEITSLIFNKVEFEFDFFNGEIDCDKEKPEVQIFGEKILNVEHRTEKSDDMQTEFFAFPNGAKITLIVEKFKQFANL